MTSRITPLRVVAGLVVLGVVGLGVAVGAPAVFGGDSGNPSATLPVAITPALVQRGAYVAVEGDCAACHTDPGGQSFAGGLGINTPIGAVFTSNITPDKQTGIGAYTYGDFERAVRRGIRPDGSAMYPAMPYPSYAHISDADMEALYAYFMQGVQPVAQPDKAANIPWPLSMRWPLTWWRWFFAPAVQPASAPGSAPGRGTRPRRLSGGRAGALRHLPYRSRLRPAGIGADAAGWFGLSGGRCGR